MSHIHSLSSPFNKIKSRFLLSVEHNQITEVVSNLLLLPASQLSCAFQLCALLLFAIIKNIINFLLARHDDKIDSCMILMGTSSRDFAINDEKGEMCVCEYILADKV